MGCSHKTEVRVAVDTMATHEIVAVRRVPVAALQISFLFLSVGKGLDLIGQGYGAPERRDIGC